MEITLGEKFKVLDDGYVQVVDWMGDDQRIVQAARVSYGKGTKTVSEDKALIRYLMRHRHTTPFEMCELVLLVRVPMDHWRQWIRHRTANVNEYSTRYSEAIDSQQKTTAWRLQSGTNKQGSSGLVENWPVGFVEKEEKIAEKDIMDGEEIIVEKGDRSSWTDQYYPSEYLSVRENWLHEQATEIYKERLAFGVAREQARKDLPLSTYTEAYWKIDLHNLLHFLSLRMDKHAQLEIREYANVIGYNIVAKWVPITWDAFMNYRINAVALSGEEIDAISKGQLLSNGNKREQEEFEEKMKILKLMHRTMVD